MRLHCLPTEVCISYFECNWVILLKLTRQWDSSINLNAPQFQGSQFSERGKLKSHHFKPRAHDSYFAGLQQHQFWSSIPSIRVPAISRQDGQAMGVPTRRHTGDRCHENISLKGETQGSWPKRRRASSLWEHLIMEYGYCRYVLSHFVVHHISMV